MYLKFFNTINSPGIIVFPLYACHVRHWCRHPLQTYFMNDIFRKKKSIFKRETLSNMAYTALLRMCKALWTTNHRYPSTWPSDLSTITMSSLQTPQCRGFARSERFCSHWIILDAEYCLRLVKYCKSIRDGSYPIIWHDAQVMLTIKTEYCSCGLL